MGSINLSSSEICTRMKFDEIRRKYVGKQGNFVFVKCRSCKGTGLVLSGEMWDCSSYCEKCRGFGGEFVSKELAIECDECKGLEDEKCSKCSGSGYVDWIENIVGRRE